MPVPEKQDSVPNQGPDIAQESKAVEPQATEVPVAMAASPVQENTTLSEQSSISPSSNSDHPSTNQFKRAHKIGGITLSLNQEVVHPELQQKTVQSIDLSDEILARVWKKMVEDKEDENPELVKLICDKKLVVEDASHFNIVVNNIYFESAFQPYFTEVMSYVRDKCNNPQIMGKIVVEMVEHKTMVYHPSEKYDALLEQNTALAKLRSIFQDIDY